MGVVIYVYMYRKILIEETRLKTLRNRSKGIRFGTGYLFCVASTFCSTQILLHADYVPFWFSLPGIIHMWIRLCVYTFNTIVF